MWRGSQIPSGSSRSHAVRRVRARLASPGDRSSWIASTVAAATPANATRSLDFVAFHFLASRARISLATANVLMGRDHFGVTLARLGRLVAPSDLALTPSGRTASGARMLRRPCCFGTGLFIRPGEPRAENPESIDRFVRHRDPVDGIVIEPMAVDEIEQLADEISALTTTLLDMAWDLGRIRE